MGPTMVELLDGRMVFSDAEEWRHQCEAQMLLRLPYDERVAQLVAITERRPEDARRLLETMALLRASGARGGISKAGSSDGYAHG